MNAEIITSGTELLLGETVDTNSTYIARALRDIGVNLYFKTSVGDNVERMALALRQALARADVVITTGGLGPTVDDVTREAVTLATGRELALYPECLAQIETIFARWGRPVGENNKRQAYLPEGAIPIQNPVGTAPGFILETAEGTIIALPGVPREMERLMGDAVLPYLRGRLGAGGMVIKARTLRTVGLGESWIDERIDAQMRSANPTVGLAAHSGIVDIRITARAVDCCGRRCHDRGHGGAGARGHRRCVHLRRRRREAGAGHGRSAGAGGGQAGASSRAPPGARLARLLRATEAGAGVVTGAFVVDGPEALAAQLGLSQAKLAAFGWVSEMSAAEAAATLIDTYEGGWGLAVLGDLHVGDDVYGEETGQTFVALGAPDATIVQRFPYGGSGVLARRWVTLRALDLLQKAGDREAGSN